MAEPEHEASHGPDRTSTAESQADSKMNELPVIESPQPFRPDKAGFSTEAEWKEVNMAEETNSHEFQEVSPETADTNTPGDVAYTPAEQNDPGSESILGESTVDDVGQDDDAKAQTQAPSESQAEIQSPQMDTALDSRLRSDSRSTTATQATHRSTPLSSIVFVITALETIAASRDARRSRDLENAVQKALANIKQSDSKPLDPEVIFLPLQLATKTFSIPLQVTALDCIGKLITYSYFAFPSARPQPSEEETGPAHQQLPLIERAIETICDCFENEATPVEIQQQIIKSLLAAVLNDKIVVHGAGLLKAVRQIYNIFIYSKSAQNQQIAQGSLTQMVGTVFDRVRMRLDLKDVRTRDVEGQHESPPDEGTLDPVDGSQLAEAEGSVEAASTISDQTVTKEPTEKLTLQSFESSKDDTMMTDNAPTMVTRAKLAHRSSRSVSGTAADKEDTEGSEDDLDEIYVKDAFLVFRALCKLSHKTLAHDQQQDVKSQNMRSKLLSLHLIHYLINNHIAVFTSPMATIRNSTNSSDSMTLLHAIRPHLCLSLSRNGSSSVPKVFEVCCEMFWLMLKYMRVMLKVSFA
jgi:brefeldin A-inhibited guanine nucleotide-exchange protein